MPLESDTTLIDATEIAGALDGIFNDLYVRLQIGRGQLRTISLPLGVMAILGPDARRLSNLPVDGLRFRGSSVICDRLTLEQRDPRIPGAFATTHSIEYLLRNTDGMRPKYYIRVLPGDRPTIASRITKEDFKVMDLGNNPLEAIAGEEVGADLRLARTALSRLITRMGHAMAEI